MFVAGFESLDRVTLTVFNVHRVFLLAITDEKLDGNSRNRKRVITRRLIFLSQVCSTLAALTSRMNYRYKHASMRDALELASTKSN